MKLHAPKIRSLGCYQCFHVWKWFDPPNKPKQCPKCLSRRWDKFQVNETDEYISIFGHRFLLIQKMKMGRRTKVRYSLELTLPKDEDWIQMYDLYYKCINCGELWIGLTDEEDNMNEIEVIKKRNSVECINGT